MTFLQFWQYLSVLCILEISFLILKYLFHFFVLLIDPVKWAEWKRTFPNCWEEKLWCVTCWVSACYYQRCQTDTPPLWGSLDGADQQLRGSLRANETLQGFPFASQSGLWGFKNLHSAFSSNILRLGIYMWMLYVHSIMIMLPCFLYLLLFRSFESGVFDSMRHVFFAQPIFICLTSIGKKNKII